MIYGVADYIGGRASRQAPSIVISLYGQVTRAALVFSAVIIAGTPVAPTRDLIWGAVAGVAGAVALAAFYHSLASGAMTVVAPVTAVTGAVIPVMFGLVGGERPAPLAYVGMVAAAAAVALISGAAGGREVVTAPAFVALAFVAGLGFAVIFIALSETSDAAGVWPLVTASLVSVAIIAGLAVARHTPLRRGYGPAWRLAAGAGALDIGANCLYLLAVQRGLVSVVVVVVSLYPVSTVCLAFGLEKEKVSRRQMCGMVLAIAALVLVSTRGAS